MNARGFTLDRFQLDAMSAIDEGRHVLVAAPTGSGKTVVAEHGVEAALAAGGRAFYTTPIKALSNQKYADLVLQHGSDRVGLLTGDTSRNGGADVVVMTTEVLRNMIYERSRALENLRTVVLDEIHYLQDRARGPVWEEILIHLPAGIQVVGLSATVSNADELAGWIRQLRGPTSLVVEHERPVVLHNHFVAKDRNTNRLTMIPTLVRGRANPDGRHMDGPRVAARGRGRGRHRDDGPRSRFRPPRRLDILDLLEAESMLPAIYFIFSRAACDDAAGACHDAGVRFTTEEQRVRIDEILRARTANLTELDLTALDYRRFQSQLLAGIAAHHAGMVPPFKEAVEQCFIEGLISVVFATETLALGINMPARSVVIEKLTKFTGERHELLTPAEYTQLTGRAGRRGIDEVGHAVVLWSPFVAFEQVASLAASRSYHLESAFRPTYNMAVNLVDRYARDEAHEVIRRSFAQYQSEAEAGRLRSRLDEARAELHELRTEIGDDLDDVLEYRRLRARAKTERRRSYRRGEIEQALARLRPGSVIVLSGEPAAVVTVAHRSRGSVRLRVLTGSGAVVSLGAADFDVPPREEGRVEVPSPFDPDSPRFRDELLAALSEAQATTAGHADDVPVHPVEAARSAVDQSPIHHRDDRRHLMALADQMEDAETRARRLERHIRRHKDSMVRRLDRVLDILEQGGYVADWTVTDKGRLLTRIYHESDLLVAECLSQGLFDGLGPEQMAALASCCTYESRITGSQGRPWFPDVAVADSYDVMARIAAELNDAEDEAGLPLTRPPDPGLVPLAHGWAAGVDLGSVLEDQEIAAGDFVRNVRQLIDLLRQIGEVAADADTARAARQAAEAIRRGVVADSAEPTMPAGHADASSQPGGDP